MRLAHHEKDRLRRSEQYYLPAAAAYQERGLDRGAVGRQVVDWQHTLEQRCASVGFGEMNVTSDGRQFFFEVQVFLHDLDPAVVQGEWYVDAITGDDTVRREMAHVRRLAGESGGAIYRASVSAACFATDYTVRVIPYHAGVAVPLEVDLILWQR